MILKRTTSKGGTRYLARPYDPATGQKGKGKTFGTLKEARDYEAGFRRKAHRQQTVEKCGVFVDRWLAEYSDNKRASTVSTHRYALRPFVGEFRNRRLGDIDRPEAMAFARRHPQAATAARAMFNDAINDGLVDINPFANMRQTRTTQPPRVPTEAEVDRLLASALEHHGPVYGPQFAAMIQFAAETGLRLGEQLALRWEDIDFAKGEVRVAHSLSKQGVLTLPKNGRERSVALPAPSADALRGLVRRVDQPWVFLTKRDHARFSHSSHFPAWNPVRSNAGLSDVKWHKLRHYAATQILLRGRDIRLAEVQLGHTPQGVTAIYAHPDHETDLQAIRDLWSGTSRSHEKAQARWGTEQ